ncbi:hypothetical protein RJT34_24855 [Clitoria ternatea]|uniref:Uncharacterized protein n=1 Tax=Clitoria ternatea TaxID=43366 RepID=A0AAN9FNN2_CLITE
MLAYTESCVGIRIAEKGAGCGTQQKNKRSVDNSVRDRHVHTHIHNTLSPQEEPFLILCTLRSHFPSLCGKTKGNKPHFLISSHNNLPNVPSMVGYSHYSLSSLELQP